MFVHVWCDVHLYFPNVLNACSLYLDNEQSKVPECFVGDLPKQPPALQETDKYSWVKLRMWVPTFLLELSSWVMLRTWVPTFLS